MDKPLNTMEYPWIPYSNAPLRWQSGTLGKWRCGQIVAMATTERQPPKWMVLCGIWTEWCSIGADFYIGWVPPVPPGISIISYSKSVTCPYDIPVITCLVEMSRWYPIPTCSLFSPVSVPDAHILSFSEVAIAWLILISWAEKGRRWQRLAVLGFTGL